MFNHRGDHEVFHPPFVVNEVGTVGLMGQTADWPITKTSVGRVHSELGFTGVGIRVGVVDTGTNIEHEDIAGSIIKHINGTSEQYAWTHGHGTGVTGVIAARNNAVGVVGVAYNALMFVGKGMREAGGGSISEIIKTGDLLVQEGVKILNFSLGTSSNVPAFHSAIKRWTAAGVYVVCSAGNAGRDNSVVFPGAYPEAFCVGAVNQSLSVSSFSSRGWEVDVAAPGERYLTPWKGSNTSYARVSGTSFSSPFVAGCLALFLEAGIDVTHEKLAATSIDIAEPGHDPSSGHGLIDPYKFIKVYGKQQATPSPITPAPIQTPAPITPAPITPAPVEPKPIDTTKVKRARQLLNEFLEENE